MQSNCLSKICTRSNVVTYDIFPLELYASPLMCVRVVILRTQVWTCFGPDSSLKISLSAQDNCVNHGSQAGNDRVPHP